MSNHPERKDQVIARLHREMEAKNKTELEAVNTLLENALKANEDLQEEIVRLRDDIKDLECRDKNKYGIR